MTREGKCVCVRVTLLLPRWALTVMLMAIEKRRKGREERTNEWCCLQIFLLDRSSWLLRVVVIVVLSFSVLFQRLSWKQTDAVTCLERSKLTVISCFSSLEEPWNYRRLHLFWCTARLICSYSSSAYFSISFHCHGFLRSCLVSTWSILC